MTDKNPIVVMKGITIEFPGVKALDGVDLTLYPGEVHALMGENGAGKSTMIKALTGVYKINAGSIMVDGKPQQFNGTLDAQNAGIATVYQEVNLCTNLSVGENVMLGHEKRGPFGIDWKKTHEAAKKYLAQMGLESIDPHTPLSSISIAMQQLVAIARAMVINAKVLILDEPTNYLDAEHIEWLKRYLNEYENAFILISHDIPFLNSVINLIYHMDNQELTRYVGDYDKFQEVYAMKKAQLEAAYNKQQKEIAQLKDFVARNKARVATRNMAMSRQKKLDKMDVIELASEKPKPEFNFKLSRTPSRYIFQTKDLVIGYNEPLSTPLNLEMERGQKIVLTGANGIGKTTLLKSILGLIPSISGTVEQGDYLNIGYFEQEMTGDGTKTCIETLWDEFPSFSQYEVRSALAKCGLTTKHIESQVRVLSGGEQAKVRLCKLINRETNVLLLDEPTNHLDTDAKDELKRALIDYNGSILMVCHEPDFYDGLATDVWDCTRWTTKIF